MSENKKIQIFLKYVGYVTSDDIRSCENKCFTEEEKLEMNEKLINVLSFHKFNSTESKLVFELGFKLGYISSRLKRISY